MFKNNNEGQHFFDFIENDIYVYWLIQIGR